MLEKPCSEDVCRDFGEDSSLFRVLFTRGIVVITSVGPVAAPYTRVTGITWKMETKILISERVVRISFFFTHIEQPFLDSRPILNKNYMTFSVETVPQFANR